MMDMMEGRGRQRGGQGYRDLSCFRDCGVLCRGG